MVSRPTSTSTVVFETEPTRQQGQQGQQGEPVKDHFGFPSDVFLIIIIIIISLFVLMDNQTVQYKAKENEK